MLVLTLPKEIWHNGPSNICWQECLNLRKSSKRVSLIFHLGAIGGVTFVRLNELYSFTIFTLAGSYLTAAGGGGGDKGSPPMAPTSPCSGAILPTLPAYIHHSIGS